MPPGPVLGFDDPGIRVEAQLTGETLFDRGLGDRLRRGCNEQPLDRTALVIDRLRRRGIQHGVAVEQRDLDEHRAGLLRATLAHGTKDALGLAAAQIGGDPDAGLEARHLSEKLTWLA